MTTTRTQTISNPDVPQILNAETISKFKLLPGYRLMGISPSKVRAERDAYATALNATADKACDDLVNAESAQVARDLSKRAVEMRRRADNVSRMSAAQWLATKKALVG